MKTDFIGCHGCKNFLPILVLMHLTDFEKRKTYLCSVQIMWKNVFLQKNDNIFIKFCFPQRLLAEYKVINFCLYIINIAVFGIYNI